ncbi:unnamed protein product [Sphagnum balticum]
MPKQEECKLNLRLTGFKAKESETEKKLVQWLNIELLHGQMRLHAKVIVAMQQRPTTAWASTSATSAYPGSVLLKFITNENH